MKKVYGTDDVLTLDNMRIGEIKYNTLYEKWKNQAPDRRRKRPRSNATEAAGTGQDVNLWVNLAIIIQTMLLLVYFDNLR